MTGTCENFQQAYNAQALIEVDSKLIVGAFVAQHPIGVRQIEPALTSLNGLPEALDRPEHLLADTGNCSKENMRRCEAAGPTSLIAMKRDAHHASVL